MDQNSNTKNNFQWINNYKKKKKKKKGGGGVLIKENKGKKITQI